MIFDLDDLTDQDGWCIAKLKELHDLNNAFRCNLFAIPDKCSIDFILSCPEWIELCVHGWNHESNYEAAMWTKSRTYQMMSDTESKFSDLFKPIFKPAGWQASVAVREACKERGWVYADNPNYIELRPKGLMYYDHSEWGKNAWHGHVGNVCDNGLMETWDKVVEVVRQAKDFKWISEVQKIWEIQ